MKPGSTRTRIAGLASCALASCALAGALGGCGDAAHSSSRGLAGAVDGLPTPSDGVIARVGPYTIGAKAFKRAYAEAVRAEPAATRAVAVPPDFTACTARLASIARSLQLTLPSKALRVAKCKERYEAKRDEVLNQAILDLWVLAEARRLGLPVSLDPADEPAGPRLQVESSRLAKLMTREVLAPLASPSRGWLRSYYESHDQLFAVPPQRDLEIVRVASAGAAERIKREIAAGRTFASAVRGLPRQPQISIHGLVSGYESGDFREPVLNRAIFAAKPHRLEGPLRVSALYGYFIFEVLREHPAHQLPFARVEHRVLAELPGKLRRERLASFVRRWSSGWRSQTSCSPGYAIELCNGAQATPARVASLAGGHFG